ncbi:MAG TPA: hypothetical protein VKB76_00740, partial [Ktedonobacterales bacterium]|nr:hypothetical protein [Ktedonobacterales bacterium]
MARSDDSPEMLRAEAMNPATSPDRLLELIPISHELRQLTMQNPNMPPKALRQLSGQYPQEFLANPALPLLLVEDPRLGDHLTYWDLQRLSRFETVPALLLAACPYVLAEEARTHVNLAGEAGADWQEEVRGYLRQTHAMP